MTTKKSMDLFGEALKAYAHGDRDKFYFKDSSGELFEHNLNRYFRSSNRLLKSEKKLISLAYGDILDVGCGTGNYISLLEKQGKVTAIDISSDVIDVARASGCGSCKVGDIFNFSAQKKYDTITFLENGLGIGGSVDSARKLLRVVHGLLKKDGHALATVRRLSDRNYFISELMPVWKGKVGPKFGWIHFNINFLSGLCGEAGLKLKVLQGNQYSYLVEIVKDK
ncbi:class I SAM-dependent methyltransferase [Patescibacteria group bacterium]